MINGQHETLERHELVNWFNQADAIYRGDLRELNELNFARFDAKREQRVTQLDLWITAVAALYFLPAAQP
jgi:hypothetical protein